MALEDTNSPVLWCLIFLPCVLLGTGILLDNALARDIRGLQFSSKQCTAGCDLVYEFNNSYGITPIDYLQVGTEWRGEACLTDSSVDDAGACSNGVLVTVTACSREGECTVSTSCSEIRCFKTSLAGSLQGVQLDGPSPSLDGRVLSLTASVHFPQLSKYDGLVTVQLVLISPVYSGIKIALQLICIVLTVFFMIAYFRATSVSEHYVPEQVCTCNATNISGNE